MSYLILIFFTLCLPFVNQWAVVRGSLGLKTSFWGIGVLGTAVVYGAGMWYFTNKVDSITLEYQLNGAITSILAFVVIYSYIAVRTIWNASKGAGFIAKWAARYFSFFHVSTIVGCVIFFKFHYAIMLVIIFAMKKVSATKLKTNLTSGNEKLEISPSHSNEAIETPQLSFIAVLKDVWSLVYAPASASVLIYLLALYLGYNRADAYELWISPIFVAMSFGVVLVIWCYDWWKFKKTERYTGWSWSWLIMPCYLHERVGKRLKYTFAMIALSVLFSTIVSIVLTLHGTGYFDDDYMTYQDSSYNQPVEPQVPSLQTVADSLQLSLDMEMRTEYGSNYQFGQERVYVEQLTPYLFKTSYSGTCGSGGCAYTYYGVADSDSICELDAHDDAQAYAATECMSEAFRVQ